jgi:hypothetical protein
MKRRKYTFYFTRYGRTVKSIRDIPKSDTWEGSTVHLYCNGVYIGLGSLYRHGEFNISTSGVRLLRRFRKKGHGLPLYRAFIQCARKLGCKKIFSDTNLNKFSRRMWDVKLRAKKTKECKKACLHCDLRVRRFLVL